MSHAPPGQPIRGTSGYDSSVLSPDVELLEIDGRHWASWFDLLTPAGITRDPRWAVVFVEEDRAVRVVANGRGALPLRDVPFSGTSPEALAALRDALDVGAVVVLSTDVLPRLFEEIEAHLALDVDIVGQGLVFLRALKRLQGRGLWVEPRVLDIIPTPSFEALQRTFDLLIPDDSSLLAYIFEDDCSDIAASIIATKKDGDIDLATTHLALADRIDPAELAGDWRKQYKRVLELVGKRLEPPSLAVFLERDTYYRILTGPTDQLARELHKRNLIIDPAPTWLLGLLGGATVAVFATRGAMSLAKLLPPQARKLASDLATQAKDAVRESRAQPFALLGFDPIELFLTIRRYYRRPE